MRSLSVLAALLLAGSVCFGSGEFSGRRAPGFALPDSSLAHYDLQDYRGKVVLLNLMSTTCPHCLVFSQILEKVKAKYGDKLQILSIVTFPPENQDSVERYRSAAKVTSPILFDCGQVTRSYLSSPLFPTQQQQRPLPHIFLIDKEGMIANDFGFSHEQEAIFEGDGLYAEIDKVMSGFKAKPPAPSEKGKKGKGVRI